MNLNIRQSPRIRFNTELPFRNPAGLKRKLQIIYRKCVRAEGPPFGVVRKADGKLRLWKQKIISGGGPGEISGDLHFDFDSGANVLTEEDAPNSGFVSFFGKNR